MPAGIDPLVQYVHAHDAEERPIEDFAPIGAVRA
jgi:hypothetical protein